MTHRFPAQWQRLLQAEFKKRYFRDLIEFIQKEYQNKTIYPPEDKIFSAFEMVAPEEIKVVMIGQDPYHGPNQAHGLCFSVPKGIAIPKSLLNIFKEIAADTGHSPPEDGNLERWATQGVFLLNAALTVEAGKPSSHQNSGWLSFTDRVIQIISENTEHVVFMLWGNFAKQKMSLIDTQKHLIVTAAHPSPLAAHRGFFGCRHFSQANEYLIQHQKTPIIW